MAVVREKALALGRKLIPIARRMLGVGALINLLALLRALWIRYSGAAPIPAIWMLVPALWAGAFIASFLFFERKKSLALGFGTLAYGINMMLGINTKNPSTAENAITLTCTVIFLIFYAAWMAENDIRRRQKGLMQIEPAQQPVGPSR